MTSCSGSRTGSIELKTSLERQIDARGVRVSAAEQRDAQLASSRDPAARWRQVEAERENCATIIAIEDLFEAAQTFAKSRRGSSPTGGIALSYMPTPFDIRLRRNADFSSS